LPETGERFEGLLPPVVAAPTFAIRKPAVAVFTLDDYVAAGIMTSGQASALKVAVEARKNILVAGGTSSGKPRRLGRAKYLRRPLHPFRHRTAHPRKR
jgi:type IV secretion system protein VirB11